MEEIFVGIANARIKTANHAHVIASLQPRMYAGCVLIADC